MEDINKLSTQELYAAWGTTREEHLEKMKKLIEREETEARKVIEDYKRRKAAEAETEAAETLELAEPAEQRVPARPAAATELQPEVEEISDVLNKAALKVITAKDEFWKSQNKAINLLKIHLAKEKPSKVKGGKGRYPKEQLSGSHILFTPTKAALPPRQFRKISAQLNTKTLAQFDAKLLTEEMDATERIACKIEPMDWSISRKQCKGKPTQSRKSKTSKGRRRR